MLSDNDYDIYSNKRFIIRCQYVTIIQDLYNFLNNKFSGF